MLTASSPATAAYRSARTSSSFLVRFPHAGKEVHQPARSAVWLLLHLISGRDMRRCLADRPPGQIRNPVSLETERARSASEIRGCGMTLPRAWTTILAVCGYRRIPRCLNSVVPAIPGETR